MDRQVSERRCLIVIAFAFLLSVRSTSAQEARDDIDELKKTAPKVYIDCLWCYIDYIRTEITFVNYVRDRKEADIHILITTLRTGSGGREYTLSFIGQNGFKGVEDVQRYFSNLTNTEDEVRQGLVRALKVGLMSYVGKTPIAQRIAITYEEETKPAAGKDRWHFWVFNISGSGFFSGETYYNSRSLQANFSANRLTPDLKVRMSVSGRDSKDHFEYDGEVIDSRIESYNFNGLVVKSLDDHWSAGASLKATSSNYDNIRFALSPAPAVEYNVFSYSESTRRQLRFLYTLAFNAVKYREETVYGKTAQSLWQQSLAMTVDVKEKWGSISATLAGAHYFHDARKYRLNLFTNLNLQLFKGVSAFVFGGGSRIHDQVFLPKGEATLDEVLLRRRQLETGYSYFFGVGLSYTFGSIFTNVVNPRFGSGDSGGMNIMID